MKKEENQRSSKSEEKINIQRLLKKRWVVPALYLIAAAGVLSSVFFLQGQDESALPEDNVEVTEGEQGTNPYGESAIEVTSSQEIVRMPVEEEANVTIVGQFYDVNASEEEQQEALVYYNNTYFQNKGIDLAHVEGEAFSVVASLSGTVLRAEKDELLGYVVEISHDDGVITHYHSLGSLAVEEGATVQQGDVLGEAGRSIYNEDAGIHVHFEIRQDGVAVNPNDIFQQPIDAIKDAASKDEEEQPAEDAPAEGEQPAEGDENEADATDDDGEQPEEGLPMEDENTDNAQE